MIDLYDCQHDRLVDPKLLQEFIAKVIPLIGMVAHGPSYIDRFGAGDIEGYSAMQFIETSSITVHLDEVGNRAFIDIFSCKEFEPRVAEEFSQTFFKAAQSTVAVFMR